MNRIQKSLVLIVEATLLSLLFMEVSLFGKEEKKAKLETVTLASPGGRESMSGMTYEMGLKYGFYEKEGLKADIVKMRGGIIDIALIGGGIDYSLKGGATVILSGTGKPVRLIFAPMTTRSNFLVSKPVIKSIKDLKGKTIGLGSIGDTEHMTTKTVLAKYGLDPDRDVTFMGVGGGMKLPGLISGSLDAAFTSINEMFFLKSKGYNALVKVSDYSPPSIPQGIGVNIKKLKEERPQVKRMVKASLRALLFVRENKEKIMDFYLKDHGFKKDVAEFTYDSEIQYYTKNGIIAEELIKQYIDMSKKMGIGIREDILISQTYDYSVLKEVIKELGLAL